MLGITVLALVCLAGTAAAGAKSKKGAAGEAQKTFEKVVVVSKAGDRPFLGVTMQELDEGLRKGLDVKVRAGVLVAEVVDGSPAQEAGIESGDIIVEFKGRKVESPSGLRGMVEKSEVGDTAKVKVIRDNKARTITVTLGAHSEGDSWSVVAPDRFEWFGGGKGGLADVFGRGRLGVRVTELNDDLGAYFGVKEGEGVLVLEVTEGSVGEKMGIKAGDVIVKVDGEKVGSTADLKEAVGDVELGEAFDVVLVRSKADVTLRGEMDEEAVKAYTKVLPRKFDVRVPKFELRGVPEVEMPEMKSLKKEMENLKKELEGLKQELKKIEKSAG